MAIILDSETLFKDAMDIIRKTYEDTGIPH